MARRTTDPTVQEEIGARLREMRAGAGVSRRELAEAANISLTQLWQIERGRARISVLMLRRLAHALEVDPDALLVLEDEPAPTQNRRR